MHTNATYGRQYYIYGNEMDLMGLRGKRNPKTWRVQERWTTNMNPGKSNVLMKPHPVLQEIIENIKQTVEAGYGDANKHVVLSERYALYLFLEGYLTPEDFEGAYEGRTSPARGSIHFDRGMYTCIRLRQMNFDTYSFPVLIVMIRGSLDENILLIDNDGTVILS